MFLVVNINLPKEKGKRERGEEKKEEINSPRRGTFFHFSRGEKKRKKKHSPNGVYKNHVKMYFERQKW